MPSVKQMFYTPFDVVLAKELFSEDNKQHYYLIIYNEILDNNTNTENDYLALLITTKEQNTDDYYVDFNFHHKKAFVKCNKLVRLSRWEIEGKKPFSIDEFTKQEIKDKLKKFLKEITIQLNEK